MLLMLFLVLLGLGALVTELKEEKVAVEIERDKLKEVTTRLSQALTQEGERQGGRPVLDLDQLVARLSKTEKENKDLSDANLDLQSQLSDAQGKLAAKDKEAREFRQPIEIAKRLDPNDPSGVLLRAIEQLEITGSTEQKEQGQIAKPGGRGIDRRPCWMTDDKKPEFIFDVTILPAGYLVRDAFPEQHARDDIWQLVAIERNTRVTIEQFRKGLFPLYKWSEQHECRFYVYLRDGGGAQQTKSEYNNLKRQVEGFFYFAPRS
jgi:hypothetical protein